MHIYMYNMYNSVREFECVCVCVCVITNIIPKRELNPTQPFFKYI